MSTQTSDHEGFRLIMSHRLVVISYSTSHTVLGYITL